MSASVAAPLRIAVYSQDGFGLGHLRRTTLIGQSLLEQAPDSAVLLLADSPVAPFFQLPGRIVAGSDQVCVELRPFNDRQLNRDLAEVCARVQAARPRLPDGRRLVLAVRGASHATLDAQDRLVA